MASGQEGTDPGNYKTWVLKVSIHCEGCKRKMKKILHKVKGVYAIDIDAKQNIATVTGNVDAESLIQKLLEYGKHAELLPEKNPTNTTTTINSSNAVTPAAKAEAKGNQKAISATAVSAATAAAPAAAAAAPAASAAAPTAVAASATLESEEKKKAEKGKAVVMPETPPALGAVSVKVTAPKADTDTPSQPEKNNSEKVTTAYAESKKKEKEVKREDRKVDEREVSDPLSVTGVNYPPANPFPVNFQPVYTTLSYNTVHPTTSYAYYAPQPDMPSNYAYYDNPPPPTYPPPAGYPAEYYYSSESYYGSMDHPSPSTGSYDMFNDENPNACKLM